MKQVRAGCITGDPRRELAVWVSRIENRDPRAREILERFFSDQSLKNSVCFTGPAGVGKSTLISELIKNSEKSVAWLAFDPSSPETGGSLLGDRIRYGDGELSEQNFIRSLSTRSQSAFSVAVRDLEVYLQRFFDSVWVETAGSGQTQTETSLISAVTVLVLQPETGDDIQWMKAGIREVADLFVIHKADLPGAELMKHSLVENGISEEKVYLISSRTPTGHKAFLSGLENFQKTMNWTQRKDRLHLELAKSLYFERQMEKALRAFERHKRKLVKNPYGRVSR